MAANLACLCRVRMFANVFREAGKHLRPWLSSPCSPLQPRMGQKLDLARYGSHQKQTSEDRNAPQTHQSRPENRSRPSGFDLLPPIGQAVGAYPTRDRRRGRRVGTVSDPHDAHSRQSD